MACLMSGPWRLIIPVVVLAHFSASLPSQERMDRHADGLFHSELSKMNGNAYVQELVKHLVGLKERPQRHSDGLFTSEYSKMRGNAQVQKFIQSLMGRKRSSPGPVAADLQGREEENIIKELCLTWMYQNILSTSPSDPDARAAAALASHYLCSSSETLASVEDDPDASD